MKRKIKRHSLQYRNAVEKARLELKRAEYISSNAKLILAEMCIALNFAYGYGKDRVKKVAERMSEIYYDYFSISEATEKVRAFFPQYMDFVEISEEEKKSLTPERLQNRIEMRNQSRMLCCLFMICLNEVYNFGAKRLHIITNIQDEIDRKYAKKYGQDAARAVRTEFQKKFGAPLDDFFEGGCEHG